MILIIDKINDLPEPWNLGLGLNIGQGLRLCVWRVNSLIQTLVWKTFLLSITETGLQWFLRQIMRLTFECHAIIFFQLIESLYKTQTVKWSIEMIFPLLYFPNLVNCLLYVYFRLFFHNIDMISIIDLLIIRILMSLQNAWCLKRHILYHMDHIW